ncbi:FAD/NAD(P)-binding domain containing protein [Hyaloscypha variabilis]
MGSFLDDAPAVMYGDTIHKNNGYDPGSYTYYPVAIIGAGESGIAMGCRLKEVLGFDQFRIFDRQAGIGGTWWINRYPGVACDVPAIFYSFSFCPNPKWTTFHPSGPEIVKYLHGVCDQYRIMDKIQLNTDVRECKWLDNEQVWEVTLQHLMTGVGDLSEYERSQKIQEHGRESVYVSEEKIRAKVLISSVGGLVEPKVWPEEVPGKESFQGQIFHSARWDYKVDLRGKDVIVVGTGCSAAQFVPRLTKQYGAKSVTQLMRSPPWVVPRTIPPFGEKGWEEWSPWLCSNVPGFAKAIRYLIATGAEYDWRLFGSEDYHAKERKKVEDKLLDHMKRTVPKKYHEILTPDYGVGCKRRIFDASWFPGLNDPAIELTTLPLTGIGENTVTLGPGRTYPDPSDTKSSAPSHQVTIPADVIILANGFQTTKWLHPLDITGRGGKKLHDVFEERGGPQMYMGMALDGFPNFFTIFGPNTATGHSSVILASENMVNMALKFIKPIIKGDVAITEIKKEAEIEWARDTQSALKKRVWNTGGCRSWYKTEEGWNSTVYPYTQIWFGLRCMFPTWSDWDIEYTKKGQTKRSAKKVLNIVALAAMIVGGVRLRRNLQGRSLIALLKAYIRMTFLAGSGLLQTIASRIA